MKDTSFGLSEYQPVSHPGAHRKTNKAAYMPFFKVAVHQHGKHNNRTVG
jgi:hypothetical protein